MRLALAGGDAARSHLVVALGDGYSAVRDVLPVTLACQSWPAAPSVDRLEALVQKRLSKRLSPIRSRLREDPSERDRYCTPREDVFAEIGSGVGLRTMKPPASSTTVQWCGLRRATWDRSPARGQGKRLRVEAGIYAACGTKAGEFGIAGLSWRRASGCTWASSNSSRSPNRPRIQGGWPRMR
jgi:hypothetical protein